MFGAELFEIPRGGATDDELPFSIPALTDVAKTYPVWIRPQQP